jgi:PhzF family phenazine biosynthesis protein
VTRRFAQVDVFTTVALGGNPLAVVIDADGLDAESMQAFAQWTNLSETTFVLPPSTPEADYRVRIFTPSEELPFAGHPTLGTCAAWLATGGAPQRDDVLQECGVGLVPIRRADDRLAFRAPPLIRSGPVDAQLIASIAHALNTPVIDASWADNGPGWVAVEVRDVATLLALRPKFDDLPDIKLGVIARCDGGDDAAIEVRAFYPSGGTHGEDPVTGSLNASVAQWLMRRDPTITSYVARQGTVLGRQGRVYVDRDDAGDIWIGGHVMPVIDGVVDL